MELIHILNAVALQVRKIENEAFVALYEHGDKKAYTKKLYRKTELLITLPEMCTEAVKDLSPDLQAFVKDKIGGICFSAEKALHLNSIFYMSALLYPENYKKEDMNDLENCIDKLKNLIE